MSSYRPSLAVDKTTRDVISVNSLQLRTSALQSDLWQRPAKVQPLVVSLQIRTDVSEEASQDALGGESLNYGSVTKAIEKAVAQLPSAAAAEQGPEGGLALEQIAERLAAVIIFDAHAPNVTLQVLRPRALLSAESVGVETTRHRSDYTPGSTASAFDLVDPTQAALDDKLFVRQLRRLIIIGLNACERLDEQEVICDFDFYAHDGQDEMLATAYKTGAPRTCWREWRTVVKVLEQHLSTTAPGTIEHCTTSLARIITTPPSATQMDDMPSLPPTWNVPRTRVRVSKPSALMFAQYPSVQVARRRADFSFTPVPPTQVRHSSSSAQSVNGFTTHRAILGVGTNMGERVKNISRALKELEKLGSDEGSGRRTRVVDSSFLYESEAMYHEEQAKFLNAAVEVETTLDPLALLNTIKQVEHALGREKTFRNGPRPIDLDILMYDDLAMDTRNAGASSEDERWLAVPHPRIAEREFVLRPLVDFLPNERIPNLDATPTELLRRLLQSTLSTVARVLPLSGSLTHALPTRHTLVMSILNTTPDSFSDGGDNVSVASAVTSAMTHLQQGAHILDIGGMSTRPGAVDISPEEEAARVVPVIRALRAKHITVPISIDTFRPSVARESIAAGADIINDVLGGTQEGMLDVMAESDVPVVLMHSRGTPQTMSHLAEYERGNVVAGVRGELADRVRKALEAGVKRWNIVVDPGIGFAKTGADNLVLLRRLPEVLGRARSESDADDNDPASNSDPDSVLLSQFPSLVGLSRKKFIGSLTGKDVAKDRVLGTAAGVTASIAGGADIVRVHDIEEMVDVVKVADGIYRA